MFRQKPGSTFIKKRRGWGWCALTRAGGETAFTGLWIAPEWRRRGYGSYLLRQVLHRCSGYSREQASLFTAPLPAGEGGGGLLGQVRLCPRGGTVWSAAANRT